MHVATLPRKKVVDFRDFFFGWSSFFFGLIFEFLVLGSSYFCVFCWILHLDSTLLRWMFRPLYWRFTSSCSSPSILPVYCFLLTVVDSVDCRVVRIYRPRAHWTSGPVRQLFRFLDPVVTLYEQRNGMGSFSGLLLSQESETPCLVSLHYQYQETQPFFRKFLNQTPWQPQDPFAETWLSSGETTYLKHEYIVGLSSHPNYATLGPQQAQLSVSLHKCL